MSLLDIFRPAATREVFGALDQLLAEPWAMEVARLEAFVADLAGRVQRTNKYEHAAARGWREPEADTGPGYTVRDGVAVIPICGLILKSVPGWFAYYGIAATGTVQTQAALARAIDDTNVRSVLLSIESPGGTVSGVQELADAIHAARDKKPITANVSDLCASAAYWLGCQASKVTANETALVGSIGVYRVMQDWSRLFETAGIRTHVITSHPLKGAGVFGAPITDAQRADMQREIDGFAAHFKTAVKRGRGMDDAAVDAVATGQCWLAADALALGLIDGIATLDAALACPDDEEEDGPEGPALVAAPAAEETPPAGDGDEMQKTPTAGAPAATTTPTAATDKDTELARLRAENDLLKDSARRQADARKAEIITKHEAAGRVVPAQREMVDRLSASYGDDVDAFDKALGALPVQVRSTPQGGPPGAQVVAPEVTRQQAAAEKHVAEKFGTTPEHLATTEQIVSIDPFTRKASMADGSKRALGTLYPAST